MTGASGGIGAATARALADEGANVVLHYRTNRESVDALAKELSKEFDVETVIVRADVSVEADVDAMYATTLSTFLRLDAIVVNAGIWIESETPLHEMSLEQWERTMARGSDGRPFSRAVDSCATSRRSRATRPRSCLSPRPRPSLAKRTHTDYSAAKAAMAYGMTRSLKNEIVRLAPRGRVNCVCPGWVDTPMAASSMEDPTAIPRVTATMALRKIASPEDVARAIVFFTSPELSGHLSGSILPIAGGMEGRWLHRPENK